jgi:hypothetical protein
VQAKPNGEVSYEIKKYIYIFLFKMFPFAATQSSAQYDSKICPSPLSPPPPQAKPLVRNPHSVTRRHTPWEERTQLNHCESLKTLLARELADDFHEKGYW